MKKVFFASLTMFMLFACKKTDKHQPLTNDSELAKVENGRIVFASNESYAKYLSNENRRQIISKLPAFDQFNSFKKSSSTSASARLIGGCEVPDDLIESNPAFFDLLDADGVVQIGGYLYRYDYCNDKTWVISATNATDFGSNTNFRSGIEQTGVVGSFPNYVDVLDAVESGYTTMPSESTVSDNEIFMRPLIPIDWLANVGKENCYINNNVKNPKDQNVKMDGKLAYEKFAIYFHFYGKEKYQTRCILNWCTSSTGNRDWRVNYIYSYRRKGRSNDDGGNGQLSPVGYNENKTEKTFYDGSRGLRWGNAVWDVVNMFTNKVSVERNGGASWFQVGSYTLTSFLYRNNYDFSTGPKHFGIAF